MKSIDIKSLLIGTLLASTVFLGVAATSSGDKGRWDTSQKWDVAQDRPYRNPATGGYGYQTKEGYHPFAYADGVVLSRKQIQ